MHCTFDCLIYYVKILEVLNKAKRNYRGFANIHNGYNDIRRLKTKEKENYYNNVRESTHYFWVI